MRTLHSISLARSTITEDTVPGAVVHFGRIVSSIDQTCHCQKLLNDGSERKHRVGHRKEDVMPKVFTRKDFLVKDVVISIGAGSGGGTYLPDGEGPPPPTWISPIASLVFNTEILEMVRATVVDAVKEKRFDDIARAFVVGDNGGNHAIREAIQEIGSAVVASATYAALGGSAGLPADDTGYVPPRLSPIVHYGRAVHRVAELPRLRQQLAQTVEYLDKVAANLSPRGAEVADVRTHLEGALKNLSNMATAA
jgi:hypothetical protein